MRARALTFTIPTLFVVLSGCNGSPASSATDPAANAGASASNGATPSPTSTATNGAPTSGPNDGGAKSDANDSGAPAQDGGVDAGPSCFVANGGCDANATCTDGMSGPSCACKVGFAGNGKTCALTTFAPVVDTDLSVVSTGTRTCTDGGDMVSYSVVALDATTATLGVAASAGCLSPGDDVLVVNAQGTPTAFANTGNYELRTVKSVAGATVTFTTAKTKFYGDGATDDTNLGTSAVNQRVVLQRVPRYGNVSIVAGVNVTAGAWNGVVGGVFAFSAAGAVNVDGAISMDGKGYFGGASISVVNTTGQQGESIDGPGRAATQIATTGGGGGGRGDGTGCTSNGVAGGGGAYGAAGGTAQYVACGGAGGTPYGDPAFAQIYFGSGGGSGGTDNVLSDNPNGGFGGSGGGIVYIAASGAVTGAGTISARGVAGQGDADGTNCGGSSTTECWDYSGPGGGGAGGAIFVTAPTFGAIADASGGAAGHGWTVTQQLAGAGSQGRVVTP